MISDFSCVTNFRTVRGNLSIVKLSQRKFYPSLILSKGKGFFFKKKKDLKTATKQYKESP